MSFFSNLTDALGFTDTSATEAARQGGKLDLGNIFLPTGVSGGQLNTSPTQGGYAGSPFSQQDYNALMSGYDQVRGGVGKRWDPAEIQKSLDIAKQSGASPEALDWLKNNFMRVSQVSYAGGGNVADKGFFGDIKDWGQLPGVTYAQQPGTPAASSGVSILGQQAPGLGGISNMFANAATSQSINPQAQQALQDKALQGLQTTAPQLDQQYLDLLRQQSQPYEQQAFNMLNNNLFSRGRLGSEDTATGTAYKEFSKGLGLADLARQTAALDYGQQGQQNMFNQAITSLGTGSQLQSDALQRALGGLQGFGQATTLSALPFQLALQLAQAQSGAQLGSAQAQQNIGTSPIDAFVQFGRSVGSGAGAAM